MASMRSRPWLSRGTVALSSAAWFTRWLSLLLPQAFACARACRNPKRIPTDGTHPRRLLLLSNFPPFIRVKAKYILSVLGFLFRKDSGLTTNRIKTSERTTLLRRTWPGAIETQVSQVDAVQFSKTVVSLLRRSGFPRSLPAGATLFLRLCHQVVSANPL